MNLFGAKKKPAHWGASGGARYTLFECDIAALNPWLQGRVLAPGHKWCFAAPPGSVNLPPVDPWDWMGEYSSWGERVRCR